MSLRGPAHTRMPREAYYTPPWATHALLDALPLRALARHEVWEPAAGAGHVAKVLARHFTVFASDIAPPAKTVWPVDTLDFLASGGLSGPGKLAIITNPPYGRGSVLALRFIDNALRIVCQRSGLVAMLLPFEFDARAARSDLVGGHPAFAAKLTLGRRIRWLNLPQSAASPMGHHSWYIYSWDGKIRSSIQSAGVMRTV